MPKTQGISRLGTIKPIFGGGGTMGAGLAEINMGYPYPVCAS